MAALLTNADKDTAEASVSGTSEVTQVLCTGDFSGSARCVISLEADSLTKGAVYEFTRPGSIVLSAKTGTTIYAQVFNGNTTDTSIDVSVL